MGSLHNTTSDNFFSFTLCAISVLCAFPERETCVSPPLIIPVDICGRVQVDVRVYSTCHQQEDEREQFTELQMTSSKTEMGWIVKIPTTWSLSEDIYHERNRQQTDISKNNSNGCICSLAYGTKTKQAALESSAGRKAMAEKYIMTAAKLIAPVIETSFAVGYDWCVEVVKASQYVELANDLEINKAITYLRQKDFNQAVDTLKMFEKKDSRVKSAAATNLSFLYYLENDFAQASSYADLAVNSDRYNPSALTNKGNTVFANGDYEKAAEFYKEALRNDSSCTEALYNIGLTYKKLNRLDEALDCFLKLHAILRNSAQVLYQIVNVYELMEDPNQATEWLMQLISVVPTDSKALSKLGELYDSEGDKSQAFQYYYESYRCFPSNIEVIEWLGAYYIDTQFCEKAIQYFERASLIQPTQVKWQLMVASCFRRSGNYQKALDTYKDIHRKFPENVECLRFLVRLCTDIGLKEVQEYATKLKRLEKMKEIREQLSHMD
ncbi:intraflagellar transport protein 88 homolog [Callospermophilus lateralis]|uniref:intraflagellar transport protein 88 homolog n=1 Tax=Callospermophilus lateralis TaxID=76772 RepID=UPI004053B7F0